MTGRLTDAERVAAGLSTPSPVLCTGIVDMHHSDGAYDLAVSRAGGIVAMIHKATEGLDWRDPKFIAAIHALRDCPIVTDIRSVGLMAAVDVAMDGAPGDPAVLREINAVIDALS